MELKVDNKLVGMINCNIQLDKAELGSFFITNILSCYKLVEIIPFHSEMQHIEYIFLVRFFQSLEQQNCALVLF